MALTDNILAYWNLDADGSGNVSLFDNTGNGNSLTNNNGVASGSGKIAGDAVFDGSNYLNGVFGSALGAFSVSFWAKLNNRAGTASCLINFSGSGNQFTIYTEVNGYSNNLAIYPYVWGSAIQCNPSDGNWHHIICSCDGANLFVYFDGALVSSAGAGNGTAPEFTIGTDGGNVLIGEIDEIGVWNRALSSNDVYQLYNFGAGLTYPFNNAPALPKNIVPRASGQGSIGTPSLLWNSGNFASINATSAALQGTAKAFTFELNRYAGFNQDGLRLDEYGNMEFGGGFSIDSGHVWVISGQGYDPTFFEILTSSSSGPGGGNNSTLVIAPWVGGDGFGHGGAVYTARNTLDDGYGNAFFSQSINLAPIGQPASPVAGQIYFDSNDSHFYGYNGTSWVRLDN
jgi:Concanavalin A-like lectin/glucanases superfamily